MSRQESRKQRDVAELWSFGVLRVGSPLVAGVSIMGLGVLRLCLTGGRSAPL